MSNVIKLKVQSSFGLPTGKAGLPRLLAGVRGVFSVGAKGVFQPIPFKLSNTNGLRFQSLPSLLYQD
ncbi:MAG TPA: hypothetical protein DIT95_00110 [Arenibacter sp.]|nr:hypothetical protein [Arenibacter sp.]|tara:strand:+ start:240 stop:440 length:201 start_codon:yes stop_codon:yes gene_type:complete